MGHLKHMVKCKLAKELSYSKHILNKVWWYFYGEISSNELKKILSKAEH